jgi:hypothetical protein
MTTDLQKARNLKYLNRDFESLKRDFIEHLKIFFPDTYQDFNEAAMGMMLVELGAFIGDNFSFYLDKQSNESFTATAKEIKNVFKHAKQLGFKPFGKSPAIGKVDAFLEVPARSVNQEIVPDMRYAGNVKKGAKLKAKNGTTYETLIDVDFSTIGTNDRENVIVGKVDQNTKRPTSFVLRKRGIDIIAGETKSTTFTVTSYKAFRKLTINEDDVTEIISVRDSEGNDWYEVEYLVQDTVFDGLKNSGDHSSEVPYLLKLKPVPYRFISEFDYENNRMSIIFGSGDAQRFDGELIPNLGDISLPLFGRDAFTEVSIDPQNFLKTRTLGLAPVNTTLTVRYRAGAGEETNQAAKEIDTVASLVFEIADSTLSAQITNQVKNSFAVINDLPIQGGRDELSIDEIKQIVPAIYSAQARAVTIEDYIVRAMSMPSKFGSVFRVNAKGSEFNKNAIELYVLSRDSTGVLTTAPAPLKENLSKYLSRFRMLTDAVEIMDSEIINLAFSFNVLTNPDFNKNEVLANCLEAMKEFFDIEKWQIGQPINFTKIRKVLADIPGVLTVYSLNVINRVSQFEGRTYSSTSYNIAENIRNDILYCKPNSIFEIKYPNVDIFGAAK